MLPWHLIVACAFFGRTAVSLSTPPSPSAAPPPQTPDRAPAANPGSCTVGVGAVAVLFG